jgi:hypothetical protein
VYVTDLLAPKSQLAEARRGLAIAQEDACLPFQSGPPAPHLVVSGSTNRESTGMADAGDHIGVLKTPQ